MRLCGVTATRRPTTADLITYGKLTQLSIHNCIILMARMMEGLR